MKLIEKTKAIIEIYQIAASCGAEAKRKASGALFVLHELLKREKSNLEKDLPKVTGDYFIFEVRQEIETIKILIKLVIAVRAGDGVEE